MSRWLPLFACSAALVALDARALSPGPPRPVSDPIGTYCSDQPVPADQTQQACGFGHDFCNEGAECIATPASVIAGAAVRGFLTIIVDEDVSGEGGGADTSPTRNDDARVTLLIELQKDGHPFAVADTIRGVRSAGFCDVTSEPATPSLCLAAWNEPATEANLVLGFNLQWTPPNPQMNQALLGALLTPQQLADPAFANARALLEVVDRDGTFGHESDPLASVARFKVTLRVRK
jgi:hypothetical protein